MVLLVETLVKGLRLRIELFHKRIDGIRKRIHVGPVSGMVVFVTRQDKLLKLVQQIDLVFHDWYMMNGG